MTLRLLLLLGAVALSGCAVGPDYAKPEIEAADAWGSETTPEQKTEAATEWWQQFDDPVLDSLMADAAKNNLDVAVALANLDRARALRQASIAPFFPQIFANADAQRQSFPEATSRNRFFAEQERDSFNAFLDAAWEIDLFGRTRRAGEAADARLEAAQENKRDVMLAALAETAQSYFALRGLQKRIEVTRQNIDLLGELEDIAKSQFDAGVTTEFDYTTAVGERQRFAALLPALEAELAATTYRLSVLAGKDPQHYADRLSATANLPDAPDVVALGLRSDILRRRPDVRRAERQLAASSADIGVAIGDLFPRLTLTGSIGTSALVASDLLTSAGLNHTLGAGLSMPIFQGGAGWAAIDLSKADNRAAALAYQQSALLALEDAESALVRYEKERDTLQLLQAAEQQREEAYRIARLRYESGQETYLLMLDAQRTLVTARDELVQSETRVLTLLTQLYKALGGGWEAFETTNKKAQEQ